VSERGTTGVEQRREQAIRMVEAFEARTDREISSRSQALVEIGRLWNPFDRHADLVHVTGSALVLGRRGTVLHVHKRIGRWMQPGGHLEPGEDPAEAALREGVEETGLPLAHPLAGPRLVHLDVHRAGPKSSHVHLDLRYLLVCDDVDPTPPPGESTEVRWFGLLEAMSVADEALVDGLARLLAL